jgi:hypothetical protein
LAYVVLGAILGAAGQGMRVIVGIKKHYDQVSASGKSGAQWFDGTELLLSIVIAVIIGAIAGVLGAIELMGTKITREFMITTVAIGYAGTDFVEGFMKRKTP